MKRLALPGALFCAAVMAAMLWTQPQAWAQGEAPPGSKNENFSAKPAPALFASDCTGAGCHKGPQGLAKGQSQGSLAGFLREHYTNSRESAGALARYLAGVPAAAAPEPRGRAGAPRPSAPVTGEPGLFGETKPAPVEARTPRQNPSARTSRAAARPDENPPAAAPASPEAAPSEPAAPAHTAERPRRTAEPAEAPPKPGRAQRGRQPAATAAAPQPEPPPAAPPPPKQFDIFD